MRIKNTIKNSSVAVIVSSINLISNFIDRKFFIFFLGISYLGLNGVFKNILSVLSIIELNIGSAIAFSLYLPIFKNENSKVAAYINYFKKLYNYIALVIFILSVGISFKITYFFKDSIFDLKTMQLFFILYALSTVCGYLFAHKRTLLYAMQKNYIVMLFDCTTSIISCLLHFVVLFYFKSYALYLLVTIACQILSNVGIFIFSKDITKKYSNRNQKLSKSDKKGLFNDLKYMIVTNVVGVGVLSSDNLIIAKIIGSVCVGLYSNYELITNMLKSYITIFLNSVGASFGDLLAEGNRAKINNIYNIYQFCYFIVSCYVSIAFFYISKQFIPVFFGNNLLIDDRITFVISINLYLYLIQQPIWQLQNLGKLFKECYLIGVIQLIINITVSIVLGKLYGLIGVMIGTTLCYIFSWIFYSRIVVEKILNKKYRTFFIKRVKEIFIFLFEFLCTFILLTSIHFLSDNIVSLFITTAIIPNLMNYLLFSKSKEVTYLLNILDIKNRIKKIL